jgi:penicillin-binding protein 1A
MPNRLRDSRLPSQRGGQIVGEYGHLIGHLAIVRRVNVELREVPSYVQQAFIATEDRRFYDHNGLDWRGFMRALVRNVGSFGVREGLAR